MKVKAKTDWTIYENHQPVKLFIRGNIYHAKARTDFEWGYTVTNEIGQEDLFSDNRFEKDFEIVED